MYTLYSCVAHRFPVSLTRKMAVWAEKSSFAEHTPAPAELGTEVLLWCKECWADIAS